MPRLISVQPAQPIDISGLGQLSINVREESTDGRTASITAMAPNTWIYTTVNCHAHISIAFSGVSSDAYSCADAPLSIKLASAINIGLQTLETCEGCTVLAALGRSVVAAWQQDNRHRFGGDLARMEAYVDHYLTAMRRDFPLVNVDVIGSLNMIAEAKRSPVPVWDGNLDA